MNDPPEAGETAEVLRRHLDAIGPEILAAAIFGSCASGQMHENSDVDVLLVTTLCWLEAQASFKPAGRELKRPVNVLVYSPERWSQAREEGDVLVSDILNKPLVALKGELK